VSTSPHDDEALRAAAEAAHACTACPLYEHATQVVFGRGPATAQLLLIGEQPGDREDTAGEPFVGPAGGVLWACLADAGVERSSVYVTNAVKHFKFEQRGKRRIHQKPNVAEIGACHPWLDVELGNVGAGVVVLLGATAARAVLGRDVPIGKNRGRPIPLGDDDRVAVLTYHPSAVLRADDRAAEIRAALVEDLRLAASLTAR
jgi:uracil-DNA glycosylase family protein